MFPRVLTFLTSFGGTFFLLLAKQNNNPYFIFVGAIVLLAGFSYIAKFSKKAVPATTR